MEESVKDCWAGVALLVTASARSMTKESSASVRDLPRGRYGERSLEASQFSVACMQKAQAGCLLYARISRER